jgi:hypothetical protein
MVYSGSQCDIGYSRKNGSLIKAGGGIFLMRKSRKFLLAAAGAVTPALIVPANIAEARSVEAPSSIEGAHSLFPAETDRARLKRGLLAINPIEKLKIGGDHIRLVAETAKPKSKSKMKAKAKANQGRAQRKREALTCEGGSCHYCTWGHDCRVATFMLCE